MLADTQAKGTLDARTARGDYGPRLHAIPERATRDGDAVRYGRARDQGGAPNEGDPGRWLGRQPDGFCGYFEALDRGKESITLDLRNEQAKEIVFQLVERVDVVTENFRPGVMDRLGVGYEALRERNPQIIYATNSGFGPQGPLANLPSFDIVAQGISGAMAGMAGEDGVPTQLPWGLPIRSDRWSSPTAS